jgi:hypothetical protein
MPEWKPTAGDVTVSDTSRTPARVISIDSRSPHRGMGRPPLKEAEPITQARLAQGLQLRLEEMRITQALQEFRLQVEADLAAGAQIESGDLRYDPELRIVRPNVANALVRG